MKVTRFIPLYQPEAHDGDQGLFCDSLTVIKASRPQPVHRWVTVVNEKLSTVYLKLSVGADFELRPTNIFWLK